MEDKEGIKEKLQILIHNLKNELAVLKQCLMALEKEVAKGADRCDFSVIQRYAAVASKVTMKQEEYAERITDLNQANPTTGLRDIDIESMVQSVVETMTYGQDIKVRIEKSKEYSSPIVHGMRFEIENMFMNIIKNAVEAIHRAKAKELMVREDEIVIMLEHAPSADFCRVVIMDTGTGFPEPPNGIFDKNLTGKSSKSGDHGFGLLSARDTVEAHNGTIRARNRSDRTGAAIIIKLGNLKG